MEDCFVLGDTKAKECGVVKIVCMCVCVWTVEIPPFVRRVNDAHDR
jgi:hypothetical protein